MAAWTLGFVSSQAQAAANTAWTARGVPMRTSAQQATSLTSHGLVREQRDDGLDRLRIASRPAAMMATSREWISVG